MTAPLNQLMSAPMIRSSHLNILLTAITFAAPAVLVNLYFSPMLYGQITLYFGPFFIVLCLLTRGLAPAIIASMLATIGIYYVTDNAFFFVTFSLELLAIYWLNRRGLVILFSDFLYWLLIGGPLSLLYVTSVMTLQTDFLVLVYVKLILNGLLYTALAITVQSFLPKHWNTGAFHYTAPRLSGRIFYLSFISITIPSLIITLIFTAQTTQQVEQRITDELNSKADRLILVTQDFISSYERSIVQLARNFEYTESASQRAQLIQTTYDQYSGFSTMLYTDAEGMLQFAHPESAFAAMQELSDQQRSVADRDYFQVPKSEAVESYVSPVFMGRGFGDNPIIALSAPWYRNGMFEGVVEGSLDLLKFSELTRRIELDDLQHYVVVTDAQNDVIYASSALKLGVLSDFSPTSTANVYSNSLPLTRMMQRDFLYAQQSNKYGWSIYVLTSPEQMTAGFMSNMLVLMTSLIGVSLLFIVVAKHFSRQITQPLEALSNQMLHDLDSYVEPNDGNMSEEVRLIATQLSQARNVMVEFNHQLKQQVEQKTIELERLNQQLEILAQTDGLTHLLNRRSFDEQAQAAYQQCGQEHKPVTMVLMDIDYFKEINDSRGHPVGDQCIIAVAELLQQQFADSQHLVARYGGEEFALLLCTSEQDLQARLTQFRQHLTEACQINGETIAMTVSIGMVTVTNHHNLSYTQLVQQVDELLYQSKRQGRDQISSARV